MTRYEEYCVRMKSVRYVMCVSIILLSCFSVIFQVHVHSCPFKFINKISLFIEWFVSKVIISSSSTFWQPANLIYPKKPIRPRIFLPLLIPFLPFQFAEPDLSHVYLAYTAEGAEEAMKPKSSKSGKKSGRPKTAKSDRPKTSKK